MSELGSLLDLFKTLKTMSDRGGQKITSLTREAKKGVLKFPVLMTDAASEEECMLIPRALENHYVGLLQVVISLNSSTTAKNMTDYLRTIHQNYDNDTFSKRLGVIDNISNYINDRVSSVKTESVSESKLDLVHELNKEIMETFEDYKDYYIYESEDFSYDEKMPLERILKNTFKDEKGCIIPGKANYFLIDEDSISEIFITESKIDGMIGFSLSPKYSIKADLKESVGVHDKLTGSLRSLSEEYKSPFNLNTLYEDSIDGTLVNYFRKKSFVSETFSSLLEDIDLPESIKYIDSEHLNEDVSIDNFKKEKGNPLKSEKPEPKVDPAKAPEVMSKDIAKANSLQPTLVKIQIQFTDDNGKTQRTETAVVGVKAILHPIPSYSLIENLPSAIKNGSFIFNLLRYTTGEISFFKDFVFAVNDIKKSVKSQYNDSIWWGILEDNRRFAKFTQQLSKLGVKSDAVLPTATIVVTQDEVEIMKRATGIDFNDAKTARALLDKYFILGFVILDPAYQKAKFIFDGDKTFEVKRYQELKKESKDAGTIKTILSAINR